MSGPLSPAESGGPDASRPADEAWCESEACHAGDWDERDSRAPSRSGRPEGSQPTYHQKPFASSSKTTRGFEERKRKEGQLLWPRRDAALKVGVPEAHLQEMAGLLAARPSKMEDLPRPTVKKQEHPLSE